MVIEDYGHCKDCRTVIMDYQYISKLEQWEDLHDRYLVASRDSSALMGTAIGLSRRRLRQVLRARAASSYSGLDTHK